MAATGTVPAIPQGIRAAMRIAVSSSARASFSFWGKAVAHLAGRMVARLWLQLTAQERTEVTRTVPKGVRRRADLKGHALPRTAGRCVKRFLSREAEMSTMMPTLPWSVCRLRSTAGPVASRPGPRNRLGSSAAGPGEVPWTNRATAAPAAMLAAMAYFTSTRNRDRTRIRTAGSLWRPSGGRNCPEQVQELPVRRSAGTGSQDHIEDACYG